MNAEITEVFISYPVFRLVRLGRLKEECTVIRTSIILVSAFVILIIISSYFEHSMILPGASLGLFEHPMIWIFFSIQIILLIGIKKALMQFFSFLKGNEIINANTDLSAYAHMLIESVKRKTNLNRILYTCLCLAGLVAFTWNSYQNQLPNKFLGFDFWDSIDHPLAYWITRAYKLYLWVFFFPAAAHIQLSLIMTLCRLLKDSNTFQFITLKPYHRDGCGGTSKLINIAIRPFIPVVIVATIGLLIVVVIHHGMAITPFIGIIILSCLFALIYLVPAYNLQKIINAEKKKQMAGLTEAQNLIYYSIVKSPQSDQLSNDLAVINAMQPLVKQIKSIPEWPYWDRVAKLIALVNLPLVLSSAKSAWPLVSTWFK